MKCRPINFSAEMAQAIIEGRKTQTRRVIKQPIRQSIWWHSTFKQWATHGEDTHIELFDCPYGRYRDELWVKESWRVVGWQEGEPMLIEYRDGTRMKDKSTGNELNYEEWHERVWIQCGEQCDKAGMVIGADELYCWPDGEIRPPVTHWRNPRFMPKWCSRLKLRIKGVRIQRVQEITPEDCIAEGLPRETDVYKNMLHGGGVSLECPKLAFEYLWDSINAKQGYVWETNPPVWVIEFEVLEHRQ